MNKTSIVRSGRSISFLKNKVKDGVFSPDAPTFLFWHGFPGTCIQGLLLERHCQDFAANFIAIDRPGYGGTSPAKSNHPNEALDDAVAVLDSLGIATAHLLAVSGGAPYAREFALRFAERTASLTLVCGLGDLSRETLSRMRPQQRHGLKLSKAIPSWALRFLVNRAIKRLPLEFLVRQLERRLGEADKKIFLDLEIRRMFIDSMAQARVQGSYGIVYDAKNYWNLGQQHLEKIKCPVHVWHGDQDSVVPMEMSKWLVEKHPSFNLYILEAEGHYSLPITRTREIVQRALQCEPKVGKHSEIRGIHRRFDSR